VTTKKSVTTKKPRAPRTPRAYDVTLRRDVQQVARFRVDAPSRQDAIDTAEALVDATEWSVEEHIGTHRPEVREVK